MVMTLLFCLPVHQGDNCDVEREASKIKIEFGTEGLSALPYFVNISNSICLK